MELIELNRFDGVEIHTNDLDKYLPEIHYGLSLLESCKSYHAACMEKLQVLHQGAFRSEQLIGIRSRMVDRLVTFLFDECEKEAAEKSQYHGLPATLMAIGGYGREEMNVFSDVDLLFVYASKKGSYIERLTERLLYILWDLGLDVGYATRTIAECKKLFFEDMTIMTSLLDARYLAGNEEQSQKLIFEISQLLKSSAVKKKLVLQKLEERDQRVQKYGGSVFVLEPNIKECAGTLRDLQLPLWISKIQGMGGSYEDLALAGFISPEELRALISARNFLWRVRNEIHLLSLKKVDMLTFHRQEEVANKLGFENDTNGILAVEKFMQVYYRVAHDVHAITDKLIRQLLPENSRISKFMRRIKSRSLDDNFKITDGQIAAKNRDIFLKEPLSMLHIFQHLQDCGLEIAPSTKDALTIASRQMSEAFRNNDAALKIFRSLLNHYNNLGLVLFAMHETHFLDEFMPEFKKLRCRVQHDMYHIYTIDTHSIFAVNELSKLYAGDYDKKFPHYAEILAKVKQPEMLTMGLLLHDIGKGEGGNHSVKGAVIAQSITSRLKYSDDEKKTIDFLIQSHLIMPHISQRRDLEDQDLIIKFARSMETLDKLNMLALLTWGDIRAVGPEAWTDWKGTLLKKLYDRGQEVIEKGEFSPEKTKEKISKIHKSILNKLKGEIATKDIQTYLNLMPSRYFFACEDEEIADHLKLNLKLKNDQPVICQITKPADQSMVVIEIFSIQTPQIFSHITGLMLAYGLSILSADLFLMKNGYVLIRLSVSLGESINLTNLSSKIENDLKGVLTGNIIISDLISKRKLPDYLQVKPVQKVDSKIVIDNDVSAYSTVIEIYTHDRLGLLYNIICLLNQLGCYVEVSIISTKVEQVSDIFYVKDIFGHKIIGADKIKALKTQLKAVVEEEES